MVKLELTAFLWICAKAISKTMVSTMMWRYR